MGTITIIALCAVAFLVGAALMWFVTERLLGQKTRTILSEAEREAEVLKQKKLLEVNVTRLVGIVGQQSSRIMELEKLLHLRDQELSSLRGELDVVRQQGSTEALATALSGGATAQERDRAKKLLDEIIREVELCIAQLTAE